MDFLKILSILFILFFYETRITTNDVHKCTIHRLMHRIDEYHDEHTWKYMK